MAVNDFVEYDTTDFYTGAPIPYEMCDAWYRNPLAIADGNPLAPAISPAALRWKHVVLYYDSTASGDVTGATGSFAWTPPTNVNAAKVFGIASGGGGAGGQGVGSGAAGANGAAVTFDPGTGAVTIANGGVGAPGPVPSTILGGAGGAPGGTVQYGATGENGAAGEGGNDPAGGKGGDLEYLDQWKQSAEQVENQTVESGGKGGRDWGTGGAGGCGNNTSNAGGGGGGCGGMGIKTFSVTPGQACNIVVPAGGAGGNGGDGATGGAGATHRRGTDGADGASSEAGAGGGGGGALVIISYREEL